MSVLKELEGLGDLGTPGGLDIETPGDLNIETSVSLPGLLVGSFDSTLNVVRDGSKSSEGRNLGRLVSLTLRCRTS